MYNRLISFINKYNIITPNQYGFQAQKSTELAINEICNNINKTFENKESAFCIFLDFAKAFDTVNHNILLNKLEYYGIRGPVSYGLKATSTTGNNILILMEPSQMWKL